MSELTNICVVLLSLLSAICGQASWTQNLTRGQVWPKPRYINYKKSTLFIDPKQLSFEVTEQTCDIIEKAVERYTDVIKKIWSHESEDSTCQSQHLLTTVEVQLTSPCEQWPHIDMKENYELHVKESGPAVISSDSVWGILRGLETFVQLVTPSIQSACLVVNYTDILDYPRFRHRGLLLDTSRHYLPISIILKILNAMEMNKMNVLHWHIVDDQSFPYQSYTFPSLSEKGAYDPKKLIYTQEDVKNIIEHARLRGIRVVPEFDSPGHTQSWGKGVSKLLTACYSEGQFDGNFGPVDPSRSENYKFMESLLKEVKKVFPDDYIHIGGDEVDYTCWDSNPAIRRFMTEKGIETYQELEGYYIKQVLQILNKTEAKGLVWQEVFLHNAHLRDDTVVHIWMGNRSELLQEVTSKGKRALLSEGWYLDHLWRQWEDFYQVDPADFNGTKEQEDLVMGGEACMWGEMVDETNIVSRIWPRASAVAERLWSSQKVNKVDKAAPRLNEHVCRMKKRGIAAQPANGPGFCPY